MSVTQETKPLYGMFLVNIIVCLQLYSNTEPLNQNDTEKHIKNSINSTKTLIMIYIIRNASIFINSV
jgi:hypothetical protein